MDTAAVRENYHRRAVTRQAKRSARAEHGVRPISRASSCNISSKHADSVPLPECAYPALKRTTCHLLSFSVRFVLQSFIPPRLSLPHTEPQTPTHALLGGEGDTARGEGACTALTGGGAAGGAALAEVPPAAAGAAAAAGACGCAALLVAACAYRELVLGKGGMVPAMGPYSGK
eukprot:1161885-Pelagomonas_calceolata.AAC.3